MNLVIGFIALLITLYVISRQIDFYNAIVFDKYRFRYFALRDQLALMVVRGELQEDSWEYQKIVDTLNFHISSVETMSVATLLQSLAEYHTSQDEARTVRVIRKRIEDPRVLRILISYFDTTRELMWRNSRSQIRFMSVVAKFLRTKKSRKAAAYSPQIRAVRTSREAISKIDSSIRDLSENLSHAAAA